MSNFMNLSEYILRSFPYQMPESFGRFTTTFRVEVYQNSSDYHHGVSMIIPIVYPSATQLWLNSEHLDVAYALLNGQLPYYALPLLYEFPHDRDLVQKIAEQYDLSTPVRLLSPNANQRTSNFVYSCAVRPHCHLPAGYILLDQIAAENGKIHIYAAGPELCFLQAARYLSFYELVILGFLLCAKFAVDPHSIIKQCSREPVTRVEKIKNFLENSNSAKGIEMARKACRFILDNAASPMEIRLAMTAILPFSLGGYNIPAPLLNPDTDLSARAREFLGRPSCSPDMVWKKKKVAMEYDSNMTHLEINQHKWDKKKATALNISGYQVINATYSDIQSVRGNENLFLSVRKALGLRNDVKRIGRSWDSRKELFLFFQENKDWINIFSNPGFTERV